MRPELFTAYRRPARAADGQLRTAHCRLLGVLALSLAIAGCATMRINSYLARDADFVRYQSYAWAVTDRLSTGDPRLDNNPFFQERLQADVERELGARGFEKRTSTPSDLIVRFHAGVSQAIDVASLDRRYGYCDAGECQPFVYDAGTIVVDLVDARTNKLLWRGWAESNIDGVIDNQDWLEEKIDEAVTKIMRTLPRKL